MANTENENRNVQIESNNMNVEENSLEVRPEDFESERLEYLLKQAEVYSHFVTHGSKKNNKRKATETTATVPSKKVRRSNGDVSDDLNDSTVKVKFQFDETPSYIVGEMRDYQIRALNWLITLYENGINGILADEMGLGKTLETISMLGYLKQYEKVNGPHLIVAPNSTLQNWMNEIQKFCPSLTGYILIGEKQSRSDILKKMKNSKKWNVCITSYEICLIEKGPLKRFHWKYVIVDEAHRIKNEQSKLSKALRTFNSVNRLLLTGTPLQNNLHELWALLNYLLPTVFASSDDFDTWFDSNNCLRGNNDIVKRLHTILKPFMLRRMKADVEKTLLPKKELKLFVGLTSIQRQTYKKVLLKDIQTLNSVTGQLSQKVLKTIMMELRKAVNHPYLIDGVEPGPPYTTDQHLVDSCGKMMVLDKLLARLKAQGSRVVLFTQFVIMLNVFEDYLTWRGYQYCRLDGSTPFEDRVQSIEEFNAENSEKFIFILSTRAGGLGINLTTADTVIVYDSDWNPQSDFQAIDRVHRIGQTKQVRVFRFIAENTIDERIVQRAELKSRLDKLIIQKGNQMDVETDGQRKNATLDMIRFGAEHILSAKDGDDVIDIDIEKILKDGALKTAEEEEKFAKYGENELRHLTFDDVSSVSLYQFEGFDFRKKQESSVDNEEMDGVRGVRKARLNRKSYNGNETLDGENLIRLYQHQLYPKKLYNMTEDGEYLDLSHGTKRKEALMQQGFTNWTEENFSQFCDAMNQFGRNDMHNIAKMVKGKTVDDVIKYSSAFWARGRQIMEDFDEIVKEVGQHEKMTVKIAANKKIDQREFWRQVEPTTDTKHPPVSTLISNVVAPKKIDISSQRAFWTNSTNSLPSATSTSSSSLQQGKSTYSMYMKQFSKADKTLIYSDSESSDSDDD
ncbi:chromatin-remodeling complex ATPase chain Iswi-like [Contarinia nasturtii]|uniref:chromatin-remodeling complex ATPase chain Iswi-like n=1 Tax=Contarinia nasturtii TaxID=265458 RepID=UPI0012D3CD05|nr:chromatin-remodeling complex ATPase chain Iswi-like [Contarinia nasturtii]